MKDLTVDGMAIAPGVIDTIVSIAVGEVEGVASVGPNAVSSIRSKLAQKPSSQGIEVSVDENDALVIAVRVEVYFGYALPDVAAAIREAVDRAVSSQIGLAVGSVDVYVDGIQFAD